MLQRHYSILTFLAALYASSLTLWSALRLIFADGLWWLALLNSIALFLFLPLPLLFALLLWRRSRHLVAALLPSLFVFGLLFGPLFLPAPSAPATAPSLTVMTFNLLYSNHDTAALQHAITSIQPDVLGVQELTPSRALWLTRTFSSTLPYSAVRTTKLQAGVGLLSRYPIAHVTSVAGLPEQLALQATLDIDGQALTVVVLHLTPNRALSTSFSDLASVTERHVQDQADQIAQLTTSLEQLPAPVVLCDCNFGDTTAAYRQMATHLRDSFWERGWGFGLTFRIARVPFAVQRLDYIWHSPDITAAEAWVGPDGGSDHWPVVAVLMLPAKQSRLDRQTRANTRMQPDAASRPQDRGDFDRQIRLDCVLVLVGRRG